ncbi:hypothetical protein N7517_000546 [Penicillium concentricum]|uniref:Uncharacterized protein n=1 Tax=Penicillium concentricum TaxID=293559 RepID=A0A9W9SR60_9EURO|nr:uncharacterized protein N7517_000546 [Penicillium concentricum]KAJ5382635.1 hypothetical protein N7517_000546 [Penicillium concentricum]
MPEETTIAVELLGSTETTVNTIVNNLGANRLDRRSFRKYLRDYAERTASDGRLINASRQDLRCANRGLLLAYAHMELICWLAKSNYTISATSVGWYSWKKLFAKYRLPLLAVTSQTTHLTNHLQNISKLADQVFTDLDANDVKSLSLKTGGYKLTSGKITIPPDSIKYRKVPLGQPIGSPPEGSHDLVHRATLAQQKLSQ